MSLFKLIKQKVSYFKQNINIVINLYYITNVYFLQFLSLSAVHAVQVFVLKEPICNYARVNRPRKHNGRNALNYHRTEKKYWERHGTNDTCYNFQRRLCQSRASRCRMWSIFWKDWKSARIFLLVGEHSKHLTYSFTFLLVASDGRNASNGWFQIEWEIKTDRER